MPTDRQPWLFARSPDRQPVATPEEAQTIRARMERKGNPTNADVLRACGWPTNRVGELIGLARGM